MLELNIIWKILTYQAEQEDLHVSSNVKYFGVAKIKFWFISILSPFELNLHRSHISVVDWTEQTGPIKSNMVQKWFCWAAPGLV